MTSTTSHGPLHHSAHCSCPQWGNCNPWTCCGHWRVWQLKPWRTRMQGTKKYGTWRYLLELPQLKPPLEKHYKTLSTGTTHSSHWCSVSSLSRSYLELVWTYFATLLESLSCAGSLQCAPGCEPPPHQCLSGVNLPSGEVSVRPILLTAQI